MKEGVNYEWLHTLRKRQFPARAGRKPASHVARRQYRSLLQRLANEELARAEYDEQVRAKVAAARADKRSGMSSAQLRQQLQGRYQELRNEL